MIGKNVAHFKILEKLGGGGMGILYKAEDTKLRTTVALKFLPPEFTQDKSARKRLEHEAQALASLDHRNICAVRSIHESPDGGLFFCMPYYEGKTLAAKIAEGPLAVRDALRMAVAIASGLKFAHDHGIVHRDIKPDNVMVTADGAVKILDFGIAKLRNRTQVTSPSFTPGTVYYMSPEQLKGNKIDQRTDIFALGSVLYEMVTGHLPFEADHPDAVGYRIIHDDPEPLLKHRKDIPKGLQSIIDKALRKDRAGRYQDASRMKADLERVLRGRQPHPVVKRALILATAVLVIGVGAWKLADFLTPAVPTDKRVLVMPFTSAGLDPSDRFTYDGVRQTLTGGLKRLERFDRTFWTVPPVEIGRRELNDVRDAPGIFGVNLLVSGEVRHASNDYVVELSLVDAESQTAIRRAEIVYPPERVTDLQQALLRRVADMIGLRLPENALPEVTSGGTDVAAAYESFLQGHGYLEDGDSVAVAAAVKSFERATEIDSNYARAYCGLADACWQNFATTDDSVWVRSAEDCCRRALEIDPRLPRGHVTLGMLCSRRNQHKEAIDQYRAALDVNPVCWAAYNGLAEVYSNLGEEDQAVAAFKRAIELRPDYWPIRQDLGYFYYNPLGRYEDAVGVFEELIDMTPSYYMTYNTLGAFYYLLGRMDDAQAQFEKSFSIKKNYHACQNLGLLYHRKGQYADAASMYEWAVEFDRGAREHLPWGNLAKACANVDSLSHKAEGNFRKAIALAEAERARNPKDPVVTAFLAGYYLDVDDEARSRERIDQALKLAPKNSEVLFRCGHACEKLGEREKALTLIGKAIENGYAVEEIQQDPELAELRRDPRYQLLLPKPGPGPGPGPGSAR